MNKATPPLKSVLCCLRQQDKWRAASRTPPGQSTISIHSMKRSAATAVTMIGLNGNAISAAGVSARARLHSRLISLRRIALPRGVGYSSPGRGRAFQMPAGSAVRQSIGFGLAAGVPRSLTRPSIDKVAGAVAGWQRAIHRAAVRIGRFGRTIALREPQLRTHDLKTRFTYIFENNVWGDPESRSGRGSRRDSENVEQCLMALSKWQRALNIRSINDIACGDFNWLGEYLEEHPDIRYCGFDIVEPLVQRNRELFPHCAFQVLDIVTEVPPAADLILCKDLFNHLTTEDIARAIENIVASGARYLLATNTFEIEHNQELRPRRGRQSRAINLMAAPFHFPKPIWSTHYIGLWRISELPR